MDQLNFFTMMKAALPDVFVSLWLITKLLFKFWYLILPAIIFAIVRTKAYNFLALREKLSTQKKCPDCAKWIPREANKCAYCSKIF